LVHLPLRGHIIANQKNYHDAQIKGKYQERKSMGIQERKRDRLQHSLVGKKGPENTKVLARTLARTRNRGKKKGITKGGCKELVEKKGRGSLCTGAQFLMGLKKSRTRKKGD